MPTAGSFSVYVIELDGDALPAGISLIGKKGALYVGYTSKDGESRALQHQAAGPLSGRIFRRMSPPTGSRLRPDLSLYAGPYETAREAKRAERRTHNRLVADGYVVFGDKGRG